MGDQMPSLNIGMIKDSLTARGYKRGPRTVVRITKSETRRYIFGRLWAEYIYQLFRSVLKKEIGSLKFQTFIRLAISDFGAENHRGSLACAGYFKGIVSEAVKD